MYLLTDLIKKCNSSLKLPSKSYLLALLATVKQVLSSEENSIRPKTPFEESGALICLDTSLPTLLVPDIHGRTDFFINIMNYLITPEKTVLNLLEEQKIQVVCLGDGFHGEKRVKDRWLAAFTKWQEGIIQSPEMIEEMTESLCVMELVMNAKIQFPQHFHFLKGNHENILNEEGFGNFPFRKFAAEGEMVKDFMLDMYGEKLLHSYADFEHALPLAVIGENFMASHAQPAHYICKDDLINALMDSRAIASLTWTDNKESEVESVNRMLTDFFPDNASALYFGGHRPIKSKYNMLSPERYVQLHNPEKQYVTLLTPGKVFDPDNDIIDVENKE